jgi:AbrB family looped-hinge helix DNA binding protein
MIEEAKMPTLFKNGRVTIPKKVRDTAGIHPGDTVEVWATAPGGVYVQKIVRPAKREERPVAPSNRDQSGKLTCLWNCSVSHHAMKRISRGA